MKQDIRDQALEDFKSVVVKYDLRAVITFTRDDSEESSIDFATLIRAEPTIALQMAKTTLRCVEKAVREKDQGKGREKKSCLLN